MYRIRCVNNDWDDKPQYWNNRFGWGTFDEAQVYSQSDKDYIDANGLMVIEGEWRNYAYSLALPKT